MKEEGACVFMFYGEKKYAACQKWILLFLAGFMAGVFLINMNSSLFVGESGILSNGTINRLKYLEIESSTFFQFVTAGRFKEYLLLGLLSTTYFGIVIAYGVAAFQGMMLGMVITVAVIRFGLKGILLVLFSFFPHQLLLLPAGAMMLIWCCQNCRVLYFDKRAVWNRELKKKYVIRQMILLVWILVVVMIGCILESYVNPMLLMDVIKIF